MFVLNCEKVSPRLAKHPSHRDPAKHANWLTNTIFKFCLQFTIMFSQRIKQLQISNKL